jgi:hypothetical protein
MVAAHCLFLAFVRFVDVAQFHQLFQRLLGVHRVHLNVKRMEAGLGW